MNKYYDALSPDKLKTHAKSLYISTTVNSNKLDKYMQSKLDLIDHKDYEYIINHKLNNKYVKVLILLTAKASARFSQTFGGKLDFNKTSISELTKMKYDLW